MRQKIVFDIEVYQDYFLIAFRDLIKGRIDLFEIYPGHPLDVDGLKARIRDVTLIGFNSASFDMPLMSYALAGATNAELKAAADDIINRNLKPWQFADKYAAVYELDHIDLIEVAPGVASLKIYGGRIHSERMQDLPIEPSASISPADRVQLREYCANDLTVTTELYRALEPQIDLRGAMSKDIGEDVRSKSDAQIAEAVIKARIGGRIKKATVEVGKVIRFKTPNYISFTTAQLRDVLATVEATEFIVQDGGKIGLPKELSDLDIRIGSSVYRMGIGGLHSTESGVAHVCDDDHVLIDRDVASYYPAIILRTGLYPENLGPRFLDVYRTIVEQRLAAKHSGNKVVADTLKITINGSFGKFGSRYSILYAPHLLIQTTITGQLSLLMLIEMLEDEGIAVVSANTDGIVIKAHKRDVEKLDRLIAAWEIVTGFDTEATNYSALYSRDVNNYIALKTDGGIKLKGAYAPPGLAKNPVNQICVEAVVKALVKGVPVEETIRGCDDVRKLVTIRQVKGGAVKGDEYLGRAVRWYYAEGETGVIQYKVNGYTVARSEGARPLMQLPPAVPADVNLEWYIGEAHSILADVGVA
jgi:hypothetical protein